MTLDRKYFFDSIRESIFNGSLSKKQVEGITAILDYWLLRYADLHPQAYVLATAYHETAHTMQPVSEYGRGAQYAYGKKFKMGGGPNKRVPYKTPDQLYYGRGHVQLTWFENYERFGKVLNLPLLESPQLALVMDVSVKILIDGMVKGMFTGKKLSDYFWGVKDDTRNARRIVNGMDKAELIAGYCEKFYAALVKPEPAKPAAAAAHVPACTQACARCTKHA